MSELIPLESTGSEVGDISRSCYGSFQTLDWTEILPVASLTEIRRQWENLHLMMLGSCQVVCPVRHLFVTEETGDSLLDI